MSPARAFAWSAIVVASTTALGACGPVEGPWGTVGGEWAYECDAPRSQGEACGSDDACEAGLACFGDQASGKGKCGPRIGAGAACSESSECQPGLACNQAEIDGDCYTQVCDGNGICQQGPASGAHCNSSGLDCPANQICALGGSIGSCTPAPGNGDSCSTFAGDSMCQDGLVCQRITMICVPPPAAGELCGVFGPVPCANGLVCRTSTDPNQDGRCGAPVPIGGKCGSGGECAAGAHCNLGTLVCEKNKTVGQSCKNGNECGEPPFDIRNGVDCVRGECVDASQAGTDCWPGSKNHCEPPLTCAPKI